MINNTENRTCNCNEQNTNNETCNESTSSVNTCIENNSSSCYSNREDLLKKIKSYSFAITELALYLDTHIDDQKALCLHNQYCKELKTLEYQYQKIYGPLTYKYPCNKWRWIEEPWPWEGGIL